MPSSTDLRIPHLDQWFGAWAMEEARFWAGFEFMRKLDLHVHMQGNGPLAAQQAAASPERKSFRQNGSVAVIGIHGRMMKQLSSMEDGTSTVMVRRQVRAAAEDPEITGIALHIDSPGGTVAGTADLAADVAEAASKKPVYAYIEDLGASAAYWVASQATRISANASALVGSIGTYGVVYDMSGMAAMEGVKAYVVNAGKFKGMGTPGTEITQEHLAELQRTINALNEQFLGGVSTGRKLSVEQVRELADGRVHVAKESKRLGLIDAVETFDQTFSRLERESRTGRKVMADHIEPASSAEPIVAQFSTSGGTVPVAASAAPAPAAPAAASFEQIKAGCIGADAAFICSQLEQKATLAQAQTAWMTEQNRRVEAARAETATAKTPKPGVAAIGTSATAAAAETVEGDATAQYNAKVKEKMAGGMDRMKASQRVAIENPQLHAAFLLATNHGAKAQRLIKEKFE